MNQRWHLFKLCTLFKRQIICLSPFYQIFPFFGLLIFFSSCGFKVSSVGSNLLSSSESIISGVISPLVGSIAEVKTQRDFFMNSAYSAPCSDAVYAKLFRLESDGAIDESNPLSSQLVSADAKYSFDLNALNIKSTSVNIEYLIKVEGCNGDVYKRPVTSFDDKQDLDARTTVVSEVINSNTLLTTTLNQIDKKDIEALINSVTGSSITSALSSLTETGSASTNFKKLFGVNPSVLLSAKPEVQLISPKVTIHELGISTFSVSTFHVDPNYSFAYSWKIDGVVKSTAATMNYIPSANDSGTHQVDLYVGLNDGTGLIDTTKPYYTKSTSISVYNTIVATPPNLSINSANPTPVNTNSILIDLATGVNKANCASFSHMAITDSATPPGIMQFSIDCLTSGTQTESIAFTSGDGSKTLYLWAIDNEGNISAPLSVSLVLDTLPPSASFNFSSSTLKGGATKTISFSAQDSGSGLQSIQLYYSSNNGVSYSLLAQPGLTDSTYNWSVPVSDISQAKLKLIATDLTGQSTTVYSNLFEIDSTAPTAPSITRSSAATAISRTVAINITCSADYEKILFSETSTTPTIADSAWESCANTKNFTVTTGDALKRIYAFTKDVAGNISASSDVTMTLDTTSPNAPVVNLTSAALSSSTSLTFTVPDCTDRASVLVSESATTPLASDSSWQTCVTTDSAITYALIGPAIQGSHALYIFAKDSVGNVSTSTTVSMTYDTTNPTLSLSTLSGFLYKGGDTIALNFSASDSFGLSSLKLYYAADGTNYSAPVTLATNATTYTWTVPASNTTTAKLKLVAIDNATTANSTTIYTDAFTVDSTAPTAPSLTRTSNQFSNSTNVTMTVGSCTDIAYILISETNTQPSASASGWQLCSLTSSAFSQTVSGEGEHTLYAWAKDLSGNIATSANSIAMTLDTTAPIIAVTTPSAMQGNVSTGSATWALTETNVAASTNFTVEVYNGSTWVNVETKAATAGVNTATSYTLTNYSIPNADTAIAKTRVTIIDAAGNSTTAESGTYTIDSSAPALSSFSINDGATYAGTSLVNIKINVADNFSSGNQISVRLAAANASTSDCQSEYANNSWMTWTDSTTNLAFNIVPTDGVKKICGWAKDALGNISVISPSTGSSGVNSSSIEYSTGNPPVIATFSAVKTSTSGYTASSGDALTISWSAADVEGLANNPVTISYTTDNSIWKDITTNLDIATSANQTWVGSLTGNPTTGSATITTFTAPTSNFFRLKIQAKDVAGNTSNIVMSQAFNTGSWSVYAGSKDRGDGGTGRSATLFGSPWYHPFAINPTNGDIYAIDHARGIRKLDAKTGLVSTFMNNGTLNLPSNGALPTNPKVPIADGTQLFFDSKGRLYISYIYASYYLTKIYQIDILNSYVRHYAGGGVSDDGGATATDLRTTVAGMSFDEEDSLYLFTLTTQPTTDVNHRSSGKRIIKIAQNLDGSSGTTTRVMGNGDAGIMTSGELAIDQPASSSTNYSGYTGITVWKQNGKRIILVQGYQNNIKYKIIDGVVYSSNLNSPLAIGVLKYNQQDGYVYKTTTSGGIEKVLINIDGANGDITTNVFNANATAAGCSNDGTTISNFCGKIDTSFQFQLGNIYFTDGIAVNAASNYSIRYFDNNGELKTVFGTKPFYGDGLHRSLIKGTFASIYYKKATEPEAGAYPEGLYFMEKNGFVFGRINPDHSVTQLWGNQARIPNFPADGITVSKDLNIDTPYGGGDGSIMTFDNQGHPWLRARTNVIKLDQDNKVVRMTNQSNASTAIQSAPNNANPSLYSIWVYGGLNNFVLKNQGLFITPNYVYGAYDPIISIRYMDFTSLTTPIVLGGNYLASSNTAASADILTPGLVAAAPLWTSCRNGYSCYIQYNSNNNSLYFSEGTKLRYITTPDDSANSTLVTLFTASGLINNFQFNPDFTQLWYFVSGNQLYCYDIGSYKSWCDNTTNHFTAQAQNAGFSVGVGPNQITFKDNQTMFISTYLGEILQFNLPTTP